MIIRASLAMMALSVSAVCADTYGPGDLVPISECPASIGPLSPQLWSGPRIEYANTPPNPQHGVIRYPAGGTGGSGGHSPEPETPVPSPVPLPGAGGLLAGALALLGIAWRKWA